MTCDAAFCQNSLTACYFFLCSFVAILMSHTAFVDDLNVFSAILVIAVAHDSLLNVYRPVSIEQRLSG